jgi:hypothetical protein
MKLKTESGVSIGIIEQGSSKVLLFNKSVRAVELNKEEISRIRTLLTTNSETKKSRSNTESLGIQDSNGVTPEGC